MTVRTSSERPVILAFRIPDRQVIDGGKAESHQAVLLELPVLVSVGAEPIPRVVMALIGKADGNTIAFKCPQFFNQAVIQLSVPLAGKESHDLFPSIHKFPPISPP